MVGPYKTSRSYEKLGLIKEIKDLEQREGPKKYQGHIKQQFPKRHKCP